MFNKLWSMIVKLFTNKIINSTTSNGLMGEVIDGLIIEAESLLAHGSIQKQHTISLLEPIIKKRGLLDYTDLTLDEIVEMSYNALKSSGKLDDVKKVVSDRDLSIAETIITDIRRGK